LRQSVLKAISSLLVKSRLMKVNGRDLKQLLRLKKRKRTRKRKRRSQKRKRAAARNQQESKRSVLL